VQEQKEQLAKEIFISWENHFKKQVKLLTSIKGITPLSDVGDITRFKTTGTILTQSLSSGNVCFTLFEWLL